MTLDARVLVVSGQRVGAVRRVVGVRDGLYTVVGDEVLLHRPDPLRVGLLGAGHGRHGSEAVQLRAARPAHRPRAAAAVEPGEAGAVVLLGVTPVTPAAPSRRDVEAEQQHEQHGQYDDPDEQDDAEHAAREEVRLLPRHCKYTIHVKLPTLEGTPTPTHLLSRQYKCRMQRLPILDPRNSAHITQYYHRTQ